MIETGDMIVADRDRVVVVPFEDINVILDRLEQVKVLKAELKKIAEGLKIPMNINEQLDSDQVTYVN